MIWVKEALVGDIIISKCTLSIKHGKVLCGPNDLAPSMWQSVCPEAPDTLFHFFYSFCNTFKWLFNLNLKFFWKKKEKILGGPRKRDWKKKTKKRRIQVFSSFFKTKKIVDPFFSLTHSSCIKNWNKTPSRGSKRFSTTRFGDWHTEKKKSPGVWWTCE